VVLSDQMFCNNCRELGDTLREAGGVQRAINEILTFKEKQGIANSPRIEAHHA